jgi:hypothetical protein
MGINKLNGQSILTFSCVQCKRQRCNNFQYYPICPKCDKFNNRFAKKDIEEAEKLRESEKKLNNELKELKRSIGYFTNHREMCVLVANLREKEELTWQEIADHLKENGFKTETGAEWSRPMAYWIYKQYLMGKKAEKQIKKLEKKIEKEKM